MLKVEKLSKKFVENDILKIYKKEFWSKGFWAVNDLSFEVNRGESFGFLGQNGAGKTTTIKAILGIHKPTSGKIFIDGIDSVDKNSRRSVGYLPEHPYFYDYLSAYEVVEYMGELSGLYGANLKNRVNEVLDWVGLEKFKNRRLRKFSKGMVQRTGLACAIVAKPKLLILDEPMSGLDPLGRKLFRDIFTELKSQGTTIFFSSHILSDVELVADRVLIINRGKKIVEDSVTNIKLQGDNSSEIIFNIDDTSKVVQLDYEQIGKFYKTVSKKEDVNLSINKLINIGATILSVNPINANLEDIFSRLIKKENSDERDN